MGERKQRVREALRPHLTLLGGVIILAGVALALSPFLKTAYLRSSNTQALNAPVPLPEHERIDLSPPSSTLPPPPEIPRVLIPGEGVLTIPALNIEVGVGYGVEPEDLNRQPGFYPQSQPPDQGNVCIAGHRLTCGDWFLHLDQLSPGDDILLLYQDRLYSYRVERVFVIANDDWEVIAPTSFPVITLTTCHPPGRHTERLVVRGSLIDIENNSGTSEEGL